MNIAGIVSKAHQRVIERLDYLYQVSDQPSGLTRILFSPAMDQAAKDIQTWMQTAGLSVKQDPLCNLIGIWPGSQSRLPTIHLGSHYDSVINAGAYDGTLGVLLSLAVVECLQEMNYVPQHSLSVLGFCDEEGVRFHSTFLGSSLLSGQFDPAWLQLSDEEGTSLESWLQKRGHQAAEILHTPAIIQAQDYFLEVHIEQGPVLEFLDLAVGVFTGIAAQMRIEVTLNGKAGHAGTTPAALRHDALAGASAMILQVEALGQQDERIRSTVGKLHLLPNASNVIPQEVHFTIDLRHPQHADLMRYYQQLMATLSNIAQERQLQFSNHIAQSSPDISCHGPLSNLLKRHCFAQQLSGPELTSGAGHDTMQIGKVCASGLLAIRCRDGLSHHPDEYASPSDINMALNVLLDSVLDLDQMQIET